MTCIPVDKCIRWVDSKSIQLSCKYAEAFLKVQITCFYISHLPPTQPPCSWLTLLGNLVDDDLMTYEHTPPSQWLLQPACNMAQVTGAPGHRSLDAHDSLDSFPFTSLPQLQTLRGSLFFFTYCTPHPTHQGSETVTWSREKPAPIRTWLTALRQDYAARDMISSSYTPFPTETSSSIC